MQYVYLCRLEINDHLTGICTGKESDKGFPCVFDALVDRFFRGYLAAGHPALHVFSELGREMIEMAYDESA